MEEIVECVQLTQDTWCVRLKHVFLPQGLVNTSWKAMMFYNTCAYTNTLTVTPIVKYPCEGKMSPHASKGTHASVECVRESRDSG